jgi:hypothetical protein
VNVVSTVHGTLSEGLRLLQQPATIAIVLSVVAGAAFAVRPIAGAWRQRRWSARQEAAGAVEVRWLDAKGWMQNAMGACRDVSAGGLGIDLPVPLEVSTKVDFLVCDRAMKGRAVVRHCTAVGDRYFVGVEFLSLDS